MSGGSDGNKAFHDQLRLQNLYGQPSEDGSDPYTFTDPEDGTVYDWDHDKKAWFPKITEDFLAAYHANYGFTADGEHDPDAASGQQGAPAASGQQGAPTASGQQGAPTASGQQGAPAAQSSDPPKEAKQKGEKRKADPGWFDVDKDKNTNVYVSGLPPDITVEEFVGVMSKCGIVMRDPISEEYKVKLYRDGQGNQKGDGLCCYLKKESVELALRLIDESEVRGYQLRVEVARFELKGQYDAGKKKKKNNKEYRKKMKAQQKQLDWRPEKKGEVRRRHERVLIIQNMFHPNDFEEDPLVLNEYRDDLRVECEKFGQVKKVIIFDRHPDGVASVAFKEPEDADVCQLALNGRWFGGKKLSAQLWDGTTDYQIEETSREREERLKGWSKFLDGGKGSVPPGEGGKGSVPPGEGGKGSAPPGEGGKGSVPPGEDPPPDSITKEADKPTTQPSSNQAEAPATSDPPHQETHNQTSTDQEVGSTDSSLAGSDEEDS